ncbi:MAG TPA: hypothetical protein VHY34_08770 [Caulobacteraceae bacterium]|jgi:hypothetical protein|nr:hypothetical protein [Caulobacteraceae bacterium]
MRLGSAIAAALILSFAAPAHAQDETRLSLAYDGRLILKVLDIQVDQRLSPSGFGASAQLASFGALALFKKFDVRATTEGRIDGDGEAHPGVFHYENQDGKRDRRVVATWTGSDVAVTSTPPYGDLGHPAASHEQKLASADPLTQLMRMTLASIQQSPCGGGAHMFFDGKQLYALDFGSGVAGGELLENQTHLGLTNLVRCSVRYREVAGFKAKPPEQRNQGLRRAIVVTFAQVGVDGPWVMALMRAETPLGPAYVELRHIRLARPKA